MTPVPLIFDRSLLRMRLRRALEGSFCDLLMKEACEELGFRLQLTEGSFSRILDLETPLPAAASLLRQRMPHARILRVAPVYSCREEPLITREGEGPSRTLCFVGDAERLPFAPGCFDLVVSLLALQSVNDLPGCLSQIRRLLKPGGWFLACLLGGGTLHELRAAFSLAMAEETPVSTLPLAIMSTPAPAVIPEPISALIPSMFAPTVGLSPGIMATPLLTSRVAPFMDVKDGGRLLQRAGFSHSVSDIDSYVVSYEHPLQLLRDLQAMGMSQVLVGQAGTFLPRRQLFRMMELYQQNFKTENNRVSATFDLLWLSGRSGSPSPAAPRGSCVSAGKSS